MQAAPDIVLRDIHRVPAPPLWPPAPGWWLVLLVVILVGSAVYIWLRRRRARRLAVERVFDDAMADAADAPAKVAAMSALLRRASRRHRDDADVLDGVAWLEALDEGAKTPLFQSSIGRMMIDGAYRKDLDPSDVDVLQGMARTRFLEWMGVAG